MVVVKYPQPDRFEIYIINLDPTVGSEIRKTRPCLIISPDEMNHNIKTVIIAPMEKNIFLIREPFYSGKLKAKRHNYLEKGSLIKNKKHPMTTATKNYPTRVSVLFDNKSGQVVLDQIRTVDKKRLLNKIGKLSDTDSTKVLNVLAEMFA
ncbi:MAG: type II toxin-antitoxin system PemK/MazF family toxin [Prochloraceae cyanobacterium]|nr:type II toxin-antitoxin system PemK/MazF family toxin [Prochloraceae cyanobacterium]